jgi:IclR family KDG regulon transcriptional repressor
MEALNAETGETVHLGTLEDGDVVYIEKVEARHRVRMHSSIGGIAPLHCTGVAKAILAFLPEAEQARLVNSHTLERFTEHTLTTVDALRADLSRARERGYSFDDQENEPGIHCIGAPIVGGDDTVLAAISLTVSTSRIDRQGLEALAPSLLQAAQGASRELGWRGPMRAGTAPSVLRPFGHPADPS